VDGSPDTIVLDPGNPQALNRYSYVLNNPVRYTDPTGMFSEDEIMQYLGVTTWDEVLAIFGEGGAMAGIWGYLEALHQAQLGTPISVWFDDGAGLQLNIHQPNMIGLFCEMNGELMFSGTFIDWSGSGGSWVVGDIDAVNASWMLGAAAVFQVGSLGNYLDPHQQYSHLKFEDAEDIDWVGAGLDIASVAADAVSFGVGGRVIKGVAVGAKAQDIGRVLNWIDVGHSFGDAGQGIASGNLSVDDGKSLGYSVLGLVPIVGTGVSAVSLLDNVLELEP